MVSRTFNLSLSGIIALSFKTTKRHFLDRFEQIFITREGLIYNGIAVLLVKA